MALQKCGLNLNKASKELQPHGSLDFPCAGYESYHTEKPEDTVPWHWHEELEIIRIVQGRMNVQIPSQSFLVEQGGCIVINANVLHYAAAAPECVLHSLVFSPSLVAGRDDSVFAQKYMRPLVSCPSFSAYCTDGTAADISGWFSRAFDAIVQEAPGFEFIVRENLSRICFSVYAAYEEKLNTAPVPQSQDSLRMKKMLSCIHRNFAHNLSLSDIAKAAAVSERECLRCFQKTIQCSPIQYLLRYRILQSAEMLVKQPMQSISEIALRSGFDSQSSFARLFKRFYNCTPREYRNTHAGRAAKAKNI